MTEAEARIHPGLVQHLVFDRFRALARQTRDYFSNFWRLPGGHNRWAILSDQKKANDIDAGIENAVQVRKRETDRVLPTNRNATLRPIDQLN